MKTAQPASLPPGVCGSGGISRSTSASTAAPSSEVKYTHGPGCTAVGGVPAFVAHGKLPLTISARAEVAENTKAMAVVTSNSRRRTPGSERDEPGIPSADKALKAYQRRTIAADAVIAATYLAGTNTRRVRRALTALFGGAVSKDTVSPTWRKVKTDWDAWNTRSLADEPIVRLILDGTVVRVLLYRKATSISLLVVLRVRADVQKVLLAIKNMRGESAEAWRSVLDDLTRRGLQRPEFLIVDSAAGLYSAIAAVWDGVPVQRCTRTITTGGHLAVGAEPDFFRDHVAPLDREHGIPRSKDATVVKCNKAAIAGWGRTPWERNRGANLRKMAP